MAFPKPFYRWRPHPWHGLEVGPHAPEIVHAYIEITPFDSMKYEIDKITGYLRVDRPQHTSSRPPMLYGFIPRTYCGARVSALSPQSTQGDGDPMDICVISEQPITRGEVILNARVVGGLQMVDEGEADDKIVAILENDNVWGNVTDISQLPDVLYERLRHYFSTYKMKADMKTRATIEHVYGREQALQVIRASMADYDEEFGTG